MNTSQKIPKIVNIQIQGNKKIFTMKEMYMFFKLVYPDIDLSEVMFNQIITRYNKKILDKILNGENVSLGSGLGNLRVKRVQRKFQTRRIDWNETNKLKKEGINQHVYFTDDYWYRFSWFKGIKLINKSVYKFSPIKGENGVTSKLAKKIKSNPFASVTYKK